MTAEANKSYFNDEADKYDGKHGKTLQQLTGAIRARLDFIGVDWAKDDEGDEATAADPKPVRLLDYACGTGMVSRALAPYTTQCVGIDVSENMVAAYNARAEAQGLTRNDMFAVVGNLAVAEDPAPASLSGPEFSGFELAAVGGGFHHFENPELAATRLVERLRPGGVLMIWDFLVHEKTHHAASHTVSHQGFSEEQVRRLFDAAGAGKDFAFEELDGIVFDNPNAEGHAPLKLRPFLARGEKP